jgi:histone H3/H4
MSNQTKNSDISSVPSQKFIRVYDRTGKRLSSFVVTRIVRKDKYERVGGVEFKNTNLEHKYRLDAKYKQGEYLEVYLTNLTRASNKLASESDFTHTVPFDLSEFPSHDIFRVTRAIQDRVTNGIETYGF